ncbi:MAG TPA: metallophosphoesterase [Bacillota bacterium]|nr:metallophosphoesterase [Bacillota bacterium]
MSLLPEAAALLVAAGLYAGGLEPGLLGVSEHTAELPGLGEPVRLVHWTDLHGRNLSRLRWPGPEPDVIAFTGDLATGAADLPGTEATLARMDEVWAGCRARYAVLGNHDRRAGRARVAAALERHGYRVLDNVGELWRGIWVAGTDDAHRGRPNLAAALAGAPPGVPRLLLTHSPELFPQAVAAGVDLALAGHTHGGQVRVPLVGALMTASRLGRRYVMGEYREGRSLLFVSRGIGTVHLPLRLFCPPEIAIFKLVPAPLG